MKSLSFKQTKKTAHTLTVTGVVYLQLQTAFFSPLVNKKGTVPVPV